MFDFIPNKIEDWDYLYILKIKPMGQVVKPGLDFDISPTPSMPKFWIDISIKGRDYI